MILSQTLPPDMIMGIIPVCMDGVGYLFSSARIPGIDTDTMQTNTTATHVVVMS